MIFKEGRAQAAPNLNTILKAIFDYDIESGECQPSYPKEQHDDDEGGMLQLQSIINQLWHKKWKKSCHATIVKAISNHAVIGGNAE